MKKRHDATKLFLVAVIVFFSLAIIFVNSGIEVSLSPFEIKSKAGNILDASRTNVGEEQDSRELVIEDEVGDVKKIDEVVEGETVRPEIVSDALPSVKPFDTVAKLQRVEELQRRGTQVTKEGRLVTSVIDDFDNSKSEERYELIEEDGERYQLYFMGGSFESGSSELSVSGKKLGNEIFVEEHAVLSTIEEERSLRGENPNLGEQRVAVILVNLEDNPVEPITTQETWTKIFDENNPESLNSWIKEVSFNQAWLAGDVYGWYTVDINEDEVCNSDYALRAAAILEADNDILFTEYNRLIFVIPDLGSFGCWAGIANGIGQFEPIETNDGTVEVTSFVLNGISGMSPRVSGHELGHNFGLAHANYYDCDSDVISSDCESIQYGDKFDNMGISPHGGHFSAYRKTVVGWFDENIHSREINSDFVGEIILTPIEVYSEELKTLKISLSNGLSYNVEFRRFLGNDGSSLLDENVFDGAFITLNLLDGGGNTQLIDNSPQGYYSSWGDVVLREGQNFYDEENDMLLTVNSVTAENLVLVVNDFHSTCLNGVVEDWEGCQSGNVERVCFDFGYSSGTAHCGLNTNCRFDLSECSSSICPQGYIFDVDDRTCRIVFFADEQDNSIWQSAIVSAGASSDSLWDNLRTSSSGRLSSSGLKVINVFEKINNGEEQGAWIHRSSLPFNTAILGNERVSRAYIELSSALDGFVTHYDHDNSFVTAVPLSLSNPPGLSIEDYPRFISSGNLVDLSSRLHVDNSVGGKVFFNLNDAGVSYLNRAGLTSFGFIGGFDFYGELPEDGAETRLAIGFFSAESANPYKIPKLVIESDPILHCGDGILNVLEGEICDGSNLNGMTCQDLGYLGGNQIECNANCRSFDTSQCFGFRCLEGDSYDSQTARCVSINGHSYAPDNFCLNGLDDDGDGRCDLLTSTCTDGSIPGDAQCYNYGSEFGTGNSECSDGIDNDYDGQIDFGFDDGCASSQDDNEQPIDLNYGDTACFDGIDNDGDGLCDYSGCYFGEGIYTTYLHGDPSCQNYAWLTEHPASSQPECNDGIDNDGDDYIDYGFGYNSDPGCENNWEFEGPWDEPACSDGLDNDNDGWFDLNDPACEDWQDIREDPWNVGAPTPIAELPECSDGIDNDRDLHVDFNGAQYSAGSRERDPGCESPEDDNERADSYLPQCDNGFDDDGDGWIDYPQDWGCNSPDQLDEINRPKLNPAIQCWNNIDDDGDGLVDWPADDSCSSNQDMSEVLGECEDGFDNDDDGYTDGGNGLEFPDPACEGPYDLTESPWNVGRTECSDGIDNDFDGIIDLEDSGCENEMDWEEYEYVNKLIITRMQMTVNGQVYDLSVDQINRVSLPAGSRVRLSIDYYNNFEEGEANLLAPDFYGFVWDPWNQAEAFEISDYNLDVIDPGESKRYVKVFDLPQSMRDSTYDIWLSLWAFELIYEYSHGGGAYLIFSVGDVMQCEDRIDNPTLRQPNGNNYCDYELNIGCWPTNGADPYCTDQNDDSEGLICSEEGSCGMYLIIEDCLGDVCSTGRNCEWIGGYGGVCIEPGDTPPPESCLTKVNSRTLTRQTYDECCEEIARMAEGLLGGGANSLYESSVNSAREKCDSFGLSNLIPSA